MGIEKFNNDRVPTSHEIFLQKKTILPKIESQNKWVYNVRFPPQKQQDRLGASNHLR